MTPISTQCIPEQFSFGRVESRQVIVNFKGGTVTSDAGLMLIAALDQKRQITTRFAAERETCVNLGNPITTQIIRGATPAIQKGLPRLLESRGNVAIPPLSSETVHEVKLSRSLTRATRLQNRT